MNLNKMDKIIRQDTIISKEEFRNKILIAEKQMQKMPDSFKGGELDKHCPLKHSFGDGVYIREIFMPKGILIISKIHKRTHPYFVLKGKASVATETGIVVIEAPYHGMTLAGTKRILFIHEDMVWITCHATKETNLEKIEEEIIATDFKEVDLFINKNIDTSEEKQL